MANRGRRGGAAGRLPGFDKERCKKRSTVGRAISKLKNFGGWTLMAEPDLFRMPVEGRV